MTRNILRSISLIIAGLGLGAAQSPFAETPTCVPESDPPRNLYPADVNRPKEVCWLTKVETRKFLDHSVCMFTELYAEGKNEGKIHREKEIIIIEGPQFGVGSAGGFTAELRSPLESRSLQIKIGESTDSSRPGYFLQLMMTHMVWSLKSPGQPLVVQHMTYQHVPSLYGTRFGMQDAFILGDNIRRNGPHPATSFLDPQKKYNRYNYVVTCNPTIPTSAPTSSDPAVAPQQPKEPRTQEILQQS